MCLRGREEPEGVPPGGAHGLRPCLGTGSLASLLRPLIAFLGLFLCSHILSPQLRVLGFEENCRILESNDELKFQSVLAAVTSFFPLIL